MGKALERMKRGLVHLHAVDTLIGAGASYVIGQVHGRYRDVQHIEHMPLAVGALGKVGVLVASYFSGRPTFMTTALNSVAQAGLNAAALSRGIAHGMEASGYKMLVLPPGAQVPASLPSGRNTVLGEIPPPAPGRYLNRTQIADLARHV